ncbi:hypothetical protein GCM10010232_26770 [Streptomyces amakusaensis]
MFMPLHTAITCNDVITEIQGGSSGALRADVPSARSGHWSVAGARAFRRGAVTAEPVDRWTGGECGPVRGAACEFIHSLWTTFPHAPFPHL